jgi:hypothetical protein
LNPYFQTITKYSPGRFRGEAIRGIVRLFVPIEPTTDSG